MATSHACSGEIIDLVPSADSPEGSQTRTLVKTESLEVIRMVLPAGKEIAEHKARGDITVQCLVGKVDFQVGNDSHELTPGMLLYLEAGTPHALRAIEESALLLTLALVPKSP